MDAKRIKGYLCTISTLQLKRSKLQSRAPTTGPAATRRAATRCQFLRLKSDIKATSMQNFNNIALVVQKIQYRMPKRHYGAIRGLAGYDKVRNPGIWDWGQQRYFGGS